MRFRHPDGSTVHLSYCSNVHAAEDLDGVVAQLADWSTPIRERLGWDRLGVGLWLADDVARVLDADPAARRRLRAAIDDAGCEVVTLNGFPYAGFHDEVVKHRVYQPDWTEADRLEHTIRLGRVLVDLLPDDVEAGSISTLPLGWRTAFDDDATRRGRAAMDAAAAAFADLAAATSRRVALAVEPEPGCRVEEAGQLADVLAGADPDHLGACLDLCHLAVQFETAAEAVALLDDAGVVVHKAQVSAGLHLSAPARDHRAAAAAHADSPFLHQVRERGPDGHLASADDLPEALGDGVGAGRGDGGEGATSGRPGLPGEGEWRVHVHLPVHHDDAATTQPDLLDSLAVLVGGDTCRVHHLDVETYTWHVLPEDRVAGDGDVRERIVAGIAAELDWTARQLVALGLEPLDASVATG